MAEAHRTKDFSEMTRGELQQHLEDSFGLAAPADESVEAFMQWVAAGFSVMCCHHAAERGGTVEDGLRLAREFFEQHDDTLSRGVLPYIMGDGSSAGSALS